jgi:hypothetical protein
MVDKAMTNPLNVGRQAGADELALRYPDAGIPRGLTFEDMEPIERIFFEWEDSRSPHAIVEAFEVFKKLGELLRAKEVEIRQVT